MSVRGTRALRKPIDPERVQQLASTGVRQEVISGLLGVSFVTFKKRLRRDATLKNAFTIGRSEFAEKHGKQAVRVTSGQLKVVHSRFAAAKDIRENPEYAILHYIRKNPGATISDIKRGLGCLSEARISDHLAVLLLEKSMIQTEGGNGRSIIDYGQVKPGEGKFYPVSRSQLVA